MHKVKIYSTPACQYCRLAKMYFKEKNVEYTEVDVSADEQAAEEMVRKTGQMGVPVIEIDDKVVIGYQKDEIKKLLGIA
jgi:glutaredoxin 3